jgi:hypothetical protein
MPSGKHSSFSALDRGSRGRRIAGRRAGTVRSQPRAAAGRFDRRRSP